MTRTSLRSLAAGLSVLAVVGCSAAESDAAPMAETPLKLIDNYRLVDNFITGAPADIEGTSAVTIDNEGTIRAFRR